MPAAGGSPNPQRFPITSRTILCIVRSLTPPTKSAESIAALVERIDHTLQGHEGASVSQQGLHCFLSYAAVQQPRYVGQSNGSECRNTIRDKLCSTLDRLCSTVRHQLLEVLGQSALQISNHVSRGSVPPKCFHWYLPTRRSPEHCIADGVACARFALPPQQHAYGVQNGIHILVPSAML